MINIKIYKLQLTCKNSINIKPIQIIDGHFFDH